MSETPTFPFEFTRPSGGVLVFESAEELTKWVEAERNQWAWLAPIASNTYGAVDASNRNAWQAMLNRVTKYLKNSASQPADTSHLVNLQHAVRQYLDVDIDAQSPRGSYVLSLRGLPNGDNIAASAISAFFGETPQQPTNAAHRYQVLLGHTRIALFEAGLADNALELANHGLQQMRADSASALAALKQESNTTTQTLKAALEDLRSDYEEDKQLRHNENTAAIEELARQRDAAVAECKRTQGLYTTQMEIAAPVSYWRAKAQRHKAAAKWWGVALVAYGAAGTAGLGYLFYSSYTHAYSIAVTDESKFGHLLLLITAAIAAATTIAFWVARLMQRLYLSERHMAIDAKMRETMAKTFLALTAKEKISSEDKSLVLAPLFRAGTDGIIQEETGLDSGLAMVARALERPK